MAQFSRHFFSNLYQVREKGVRQPKPGRNSSFINQSLARNKDYYLWAGTKINTGAEVFWENVVVTLPFRWFRMRLHQFTIIKMKTQSSDTLERSEVKSLRVYALGRGLLSPTCGHLSRSTPHPSSQSGYHMAKQYDESFPHVEGGLTFQHVQHIKINSWKRAQCL